jgi:hypothetical protein
MMSGYFFIGTFFLIMIYIIYQCTMYDVMVRKEKLREKMKNDEFDKKRA